MEKSNLTESVRQRILNEARRSKQDNGALLTRYAIERLLYRLSQSLHRDRFSIPEGPIKSARSNRAALGAK